jgi:sugar phosphate isomerase/epimerase
LKRIKRKGKMEGKKPAGLSGLCIHTITTKPLDIKSAIEKYSALGVRGITVWRDACGQFSFRQIANMISQAGMVPVSLCRGGFFPSVDENQRKAAIADNIRAIEEASELGAPMLVLVCGSDPGQPLEKSRQQIKIGIEAILPFAEKLRVKLAIEPLHPVYADTRSAICTMKQANEFAGYFNSPWLGVAVDVYHVWWDQDLEKEILYCGKNNRLFAFHICDWKVPTTNILLDRGIMGEGCIDISQIRSWMINSGFQGFDEVEIFSEIYWNSDQDEYLDKIIAAYRHI